MIRVESQRSETLFPMHKAARRVEIRQRFTVRAELYKSTRVLFSGGLRFRTATQTFVPNECRILPFHRGMGFVRSIRIEAAWAESTLGKEGLCLAMAGEYCHTAQRPREYHNRRPRMWHFRDRVPILNMYRCDCIFIAQS